MFKTRSLSFMLILPVAIAIFAFAGCGQKAPPATSADPAVQAQIEKDAELKAKEEELVKREEEVASQEEQARKDAEVALKQREQDLAKREAAFSKASAPKPAATTASAPKPAAPAGPRKYTVAAGTSFSVQLPATITTKKAKVGDRVAANLNSDLIIDGKVIAKAGALLQGSITEVVSGSNKIGGTPMLGLNFDNLTLADGSDAPISASIKQVSGKSDTGRDTAKIAGGAVIGGVIGNQMGKNGNVIGALIGAAAGTAAAKSTGTEVELPAGTVLGVTLNSPVTVEM
jgi:predicted small lipoprotein YifL